MSSTTEHSSNSSIASNDTLESIHDIEDIDILNHNDSPTGEPHDLSINGDATSEARNTRELTNSTNIANIEHETDNNNNNISHRTSTTTTITHQNTQHNVTNTTTTSTSTANNDKEGINNNIQLDNILGHKLHNGKPKFEYKWKNSTLITYGNEHIAIKNPELLINYLKRCLITSKAKHDALVAKLRHEQVIYEYLLQDTDSAENLPCDCLHKSLKLTPGNIPKLHTVNKAKAKATQHILRMQNKITSEERGALLWAIDEAQKSLTEILATGNISNAMITHNCQYFRPALELLRTKLATKRGDGHTHAATPHLITDDKIKDHSLRRGKTTFITAKAMKYDYEILQRHNPAMITKYVSALKKAGSRRFKYLVDAQPTIILLFNDNANTSA